MHRIVEIKVSQVWKIVCDKKYIRSYLSWSLSNHVFQGIFTLTYIVIVIFTIHLISQMCYFPTKIQGFPNIFFQKRTEEIDFG